MEEFNIYGKITLDLDFDIDAESEEQAIEMAKEYLMDYYHLNVSNAYHNAKNVIIDLDVM